jgi:DNA-binding response OmpR family regulator
LSLVKRLAEQEIPVVVLTARGDLDSRIAGLNAGALQYFVKPTDMNELVAGIRSQLRRNTGQPARAPAPFLTWRLDPLSACLVAPNHQIISLTSRELELLGCLMATPGAMVAKQALIDAMGYADVDDGFHRIESQLTRLRRKTLDIAGLALPVRAVFGRGLVFVP